MSNGTNTSQIKDVTRGFRGRKPVIGAADATSATVAPLSPSPSPLSPSPQLTIPTVSKVGCAPGSGKDDTPPSVPAIAATTTSGLIAAVDSATGGGGFEGGRGGGGGGRPPTAPSHGPGRRMGDRPASAAPAVRRQRSGWNLISAGIDNKVSSQGKGGGICSSSRAHLFGVSRLVGLREKLRTPWALRSRSADPVEKFLLSPFTLCSVSEVCDESV